MQLLPIKFFSFLLRNVRWKCQISRDLQRISENVFVVEFKSLRNVLHEQIVLDIK